MFRMLVPAFAGALFFCTPAVAQEQFGNQSVITLARAGIGADVLLAKIASLPCSYDVSTDGIVALKTAGVANVVIAAMVDRCTGASKAQGVAGEGADPAVKRSSGLYIDLGTDAAHRLVKVRPTNASGGRMTGNGSLLFPFRTKLAIPRASAQAQAASARPTFYFYFDTGDQRVSDFGAAATFSAQSPSEFNLVRFKLHDGQREMVVGKQKLFGASIGIDSKDAINFSVDEIGDGIFVATLAEDLKPGEYGFVLQAAGNTYRIYDFQVPG